MTNFDNFLNQLKQNLSKKFKVSCPAILPGGEEVTLAASRTTFSWKGLVCLSQHILVIKNDKALPEDIKNLFQQGFEYGKKTNRVPLLRGLQFGYMIFPVVITENPEPSLIGYANQKPPQRFSLFEFPVVVDLKSNQCHYYRKTAAWGALFFSNMRKVVEDNILKALA